MRRPKAFQFLAVQLLGLGIVPPPMMVMVPPPIMVIVIVPVVFYRALWPEVFQFLVVQKVGFGTVPPPTMVMMPPPLVMMVFHHMRLLRSGSLRRLDCGNYGGQKDGHRR
jgi:hypothetical protein